MQALASAAGIGCPEGRRTCFETIDEMQKVLDDYLVGYNQLGLHEGRGMNGGRLAAAFIEGLPRSTHHYGSQKPGQQPVETPHEMPARKAAPSADYPV